MSKARPASIRSKEIAVSLGHCVSYRLGLVCCSAKGKRVFGYWKTPMKLFFSQAPRLPIPTDSPRGPSVQSTPDPLKFIRMPGASLIDFLNRIAMTNYPCWLCHRL